MYKEIDFIDLNNTYGGSHVFFISFIKAFDSEFHLKKFIRNKKLYEMVNNEHSIRLSSAKFILIFQLIKWIVLQWITKNKKIIIFNGQHEILLSFFLPRKHKIIAIRHSSFGILGDRKKITHIIYLGVSQLFAYLVFVSKKTQKDYIALNGLAKTVSINNYLDDKWFSKSYPHSRHPSKIRIAIVGRVDQFKGHLMLLKAIANIKNIELHIIGDGPEINKIKLYVAARKLKNIVYYGWQDNPIKIYKFMDILAHPSESEGGLPYAVMEFMALGKPIVASSMPQISQFVKDGVHGYLCPANEPQTWHMRILQLVNNHSLRKKMGLNSKKMAFNNFSKGSFVQAYQKILND